MTTGIPKFIHLISICAAATAMLAQAAPPAPPAPSPQAAPPAQPAPRTDTRVIVHNGAATRVLVRSGYAAASYLGVSVREVSHDEAAALKLPDESGVEVTVVDQDSPAGKAGVKEHDVIRKFNGETVESRAQLMRMLSETPSGHTVTLQVMRNGQPMDLKVQLADRHGDWVMPPRMEIPMPEIPPMDPGNIAIIMGVARSGVQVESLTPQLREFFGAPAEQGLLVRSVDRGSPADQAGLRAGDVIVKIGDRPIRSAGDYRIALRDSSGKSVSVAIIRDKREQSLTMKLPERRESSSAFEGLDVQLSGLEDGLAGLDSQLAMLQAQKAQWKDWQKALEKSQKEWQKSWEKSREDWQKQMRDWDRQWQDRDIH